MLNFCVNAHSSNLNAQTNAHSSSAFNIQHAQVPNEFITYRNSCSDKLYFVIKELVDFFKIYASVRQEVLDYVSGANERKQKLESMCQIRDQIAQITDQYFGAVQCFLNQLEQMTNNANIDTIEEQLYQLNGSAYDCADRIIHGRVEIYDIYLGDDQL